MRKILSIAALFISFLAHGQSENSVYITSDSSGIWNYDPWHSASFNLRISRHPGDTAQYPAILFMPGVGEMTSDTNSLTAYGPHWAMKSNGWNGSVQLANGTHYPVYITMTWNVSPPQPPLAGVAWMIAYLQKAYHLKIAATYWTGLSEGTFTGGEVLGLDLATDSVMKKIKAVAFFSGTGTATPTAAAPWGYFGHWAKQYGGRAFLTVGYADAQSAFPPLQAKAMNDSFPGSAYYATNTNDGGQHGGWNTFYNQNFTGYSVVAPVGQYITTNASPNTQGTYIPGENIYQWMLRQGDTTLVGQPAVVAAPVNKPPVALITNPAVALSQPTDSVRLSCSNSYDSDGKIVSYKWVQTSGPIQATMVKNADSSVTVFHLANGLYTFQLTVTDNAGASSSTSATVAEIFIPVICQVCPPPATCPAQRTAVGFSLTLINGALTTIVTYSDGSTGPITPQ